ncbi:hypothetical protein Tco_1112518 [Tanacetum coccineum]|uniref:Uncharacterized protein n=1 Tax=Tanacetum coccineum TaxID=301880 RepID=A0ABQ5IR20_9ASTR
MSSGNSKSNVRWHKICACGDEIRHHWNGAANTTFVLDLNVDSKNILDRVSSSKRRDLSNLDVLDFTMLACFITGTSQSRTTGKSQSLTYRHSAVEVDSGRIPSSTVNTLGVYSDVLARYQGYA